MNSWIKRLKTARRAKIVGANVDKFDKSFELLKKYERHSGAGVNLGDVAAAIDAGQKLAEFIELLARPPCR